MADVVCNQAKGRFVEFAERVKANDPTNSALIVVVIDAGAATDDTLRGYDNLSLLLGDAAVTERNTNGWTRKTITDTETITIVYDDTADEATVDIDDITWTAVGAGGGDSTDLVLCYDADTTGGDDTNIIPISIHDFVITPDGSDVTATIDAAGILAAT